MSKLAISANRKVAEQIIAISCPLTGRPQLLLHLGQLWGETKYIPFLETTTNDDGNSKEWSNYSADDLLFVVIIAR